MENFRSVVFEGIPWMTADARYFPLWSLIGIAKEKAMVQSDSSKEKDKAPLVEGV
ncbi:hypothetical protein [Paraburkholderia sp. BR14374]|uniref:hypothetical protein n=1 Tax=Paraburkholderia sp. BR14374 TaxID=3237007 RepID=UPI0034CF0EF7